MKVPAVVDHLIIPLRALMVLGILAALAYSVVFFFLGYGDEEARDPRTLQEWNMPTEVSANDIIKANVFGELPVEEIAPEIVETNLNLRLVGISFHTEDPTKSRAFIVGRARQKPKRYEIGEQVEGVAELSDILSDHVLLRRGDRKESLYIEKRKQLISTVQETSMVSEQPAGSRQFITQASLAHQVSAEHATPEATTTGLPRQFESSRTHTKENPDELLNGIESNTVERGAFAGYHIQDKLAARRGVETGDTLLSVNGQRVAPTKTDLESTQKQLDAGSLELEVQRGETKITVNYTPNQ